MDFFNSLSLDLKLLAVGIAGCVLLGLFSGNRKAEKRYMVVLAVLAAVGVYRFSHFAGGDASVQGTGTTRVVQHSKPVAPPHKPLVSTFGSK